MPLPNDTEHHAIFGQNGSGKTVFGLWQLAQRNFDRKPWVIVDYKRDPLIKRIPRLEQINVSGKPPRHAGLYVIRPSIDDKEDGVTSEFLWKVWERENTGVFIDEGYMFNMGDRSLQALLTQGRSKHIPVIALSQRPSWVSPFIMSEASHLSVFYLQMPQDLKRIREFIPNIDPHTLDPHWSYYTYTKERRIYTLSPCPDENEILNLYDDRRIRKSWFGL